MCLGPRTQPHPPEAPARPRGRPRGRQMSQLRQWPLPGGKQQSAPALSLGRMACGLSAASGPGALPGAPPPRSGLGAEMKQLKTGSGDKGGVSSCGWRARMGSARQGCSFIVDSRTPQWPDLAPPPTPKRQRKQPRRPQQGHSAVSYRGTLVSFSKPSTWARADTEAARTPAPCGLAVPHPEQVTLRAGQLMGRGSNSACPCWLVMLQVAAVTGGAKAESAGLLGKRH